VPRTGRAEQRRHLYITLKGEKGARANRNRGEVWVIKTLSWSGGAGGGKGKKEQPSRRKEKIAKQANGRGQKIPLGSREEESQRLPSERRRLPVSPTDVGKKVGKREGERKAKLVILDTYFSSTPLSGKFCGGAPKGKESHEATVVLGLGER